ncbi:MAG: nicotinamide riboside transporter PnuC [Bernardetiaceae bacterium]
MLLGDFVFKMTYIELLAALAGIISIWYNTQVSVRGWLWAIVSVTPYLYIFFVAKLYQDLLLHIVYLVMAIYGYWQWTRKDAQQRPVLPITYTPAPERYAWAVAGVAATGLSGWFFGTFTDTDLPYWDALTTVFSLIATWMLARKRIENWPIWIFVDTFAVFIYAYKGLYITSGLYAIYWVLALMGWRRWRVVYASQTSV